VSRRAIVLLARAPSAPGKTRLTAGWPAGHARALREALFLDSLAIARSLDVPVTVAYTPAAARDEMAALTGGRSTMDRGPSPAGREPSPVGREPATPGQALEIDLRPQCGDDLGARMLHAISAGLTGADHVVLMGSDLPTLPRAYLVDAFAELESGADCVFGPTEDGGYYLVGARRGMDMSRVLTGIPWGAGQVLQATLMAARASGVAAAVTRAWFDVDVPADLRRVVGDTRLADQRRDFYSRFLSRT
jgi:2-phospho-L-lactate guanylyltransferase (CobY/MobA/RfbA family)